MNSDDVRARLAKTLTAEQADALLPTVRSIAAEELRSAAGWAPGFHSDTDNAWRRQLNDRANELG